MSSTDIDTTTDGATTTVASMFPPKPGQLEKARADAEKIAAKIVSQDPASPAFESALEQIREIGREEVGKSSKAMDELLSRKSFPRDGHLESIDATTSQLADLRDVVVDLDPTGTPATFKGRLVRATRKLPGGQALRKFLTGYGTPGSQIRDIQKTLKHTRETLDGDVKLAAIERKSIWTDLERLGSQDARFSTLADAIRSEAGRLRDAGDNAQADAIESKALVAVQTRQQDVAVHAAVIMNTYQSLGVLAGTGRELVDAVRRTETTTLTALKTVGMTDAIVDGQKAAGKQVDAMRDVTSNLVVKSSEKLAEHTLEVAENATRTAVDIDAVKTAFRNVYEAQQHADAKRLEASQKLDAQIQSLNESLSEFRGRGFEHAGEVEAK